MDPAPALQVPHLISSERLVFSSDPLPTVAKKRPRQQLSAPLDNPQAGRAKAGSEHALGNSPVNTK